MIDRVSARLERRLYEVPVGFKFFVEGLLDGRLGFAGEESAGSSFLARDGSVWSTDKDGIIPCLLSAEVTARMGKDPGEIYRQLTRDLGDPVYERIDAPATREQKAALQKLSAADVRITEIAGENVQQILTEAPGDHNAIGGIKVIGREWLVCGPPIRHGGDLQDLRRELPRSRPSTTHPRGSADNRFRDARTQRASSGRLLSRRKESCMSSPASTNRPSLHVSDALADLALDMPWSFNHSADQLWAAH